MAGNAERLQDMILLIGGTAEAGVIAGMLAKEGRSVLVSGSTDISIDTGSHPGIRRRTGPLDPDAMLTLVKEENINVIVIAAHPYSETVRKTAAEVARRTGIPCFNYLRPPVFIRRGNDAPLVNSDGVSYFSGSGAYANVLFSVSHKDAARLAFSYGRPVLSTVGSRNISVYAAESRAKGVLLFARALDHPDSIRACLDAGIPAERIISGRGPFSVRDNQTHIRKTGAGVIVTKDGGMVSGVLEKYEAARAEKCRLIVVDRPHTDIFEAHYSAPESLVYAILEYYMSGLKTVFHGPGGLASRQAAGAPGRMKTKPNSDSIIT